MRTVFGHDFLVLLYMQRGRLQTLHCPSTSTVKCLAQNFALEELVDSPRQRWHLYHLNSAREGISFSYWNSPCTLIPLLNIFIVIEGPRIISLPLFFPFLLFFFVSPLTKKQLLLTKSNEVRRLLMFELLTLIKAVVQEFFRRLKRKTTATAQKSTYRTFFVRYEEKTIPLDIFLTHLSLLLEVYHLLRCFIVFVVRN
jgi:hypothetical protein